MGRTAQVTKRLPDGQHYECVFVRPGNWFGPYLLDGIPPIVVRSLKWHPSVGDQMPIRRLPGGKWGAAGPPFKPDLVRVPRPYPPPDPYLGLGGDPPHYLAVETPADALRDR